MPLAIAGKTVLVTGQNAALVPGEPIAA